MSGTIAQLNALIAKYGDARVIAVIEAMQAERAARAAKEKKS